MASLPGDLQMVKYAVPAFCYCHHIQRSAIQQALGGQPKITSTLLISKYRFVTTFLISMFISDTYML